MSKQSKSTEEVGAAEYGFYLIVAALFGWSVLALITQFAFKIITGMVIKFWQAALVDLAISAVIFVMLWMLGIAARE